MTEYQDDPKNKPHQKLIEYGKDTRFGSDRGADPSAAAKKGNRERASVRRASRTIARRSVGEVMEMMAELEQLPVATAVAIAKFKKAMKGDVRAMQAFTEDVDGKLIEKKVEATMTLADLVNGSLEFDDEYAESITEEGGEADSEVAE